MVGIDCIRSPESSSNHFSNCCRTVFLKTRTAVKSDADSGAGQVEKDWKDERQSYMQLTTH